MPAQEGRLGVRIGEGGVGGAPHHVSSSSSPQARIEGGLGWQQGAPEDRQCHGVDSPPRLRPRSHPSSASQTCRAGDRRGLGKQREPGEAREPAAGSGGLEVTAVTSGQGPQGVCLTHRVSDLEGDLGANELMHHPVMGSRKAGFMKQTCTLSDIYVNIYVTFMSHFGISSYFANLKIGH